VIRTSNDSFDLDDMHILHTVRRRIWHIRKLRQNERKEEKKQVAQLSQRDRAAGWVIVMAKSRRLELGDNIYGHYRFIVNHCDIIGLKICRIRWKKTQNKGYYAVQGQLRLSRSV